MTHTDEFDTKRVDGLRELAKIELSNIIATANDEGFTAIEVLDAFAAAVEESRLAYAEDPDAADDPPLAAEQGFSPA
jgi:hypothetical protein